LAKRSDRSPPLAYLALFLAWIVPGAGHVYLGRVQRGLILFLAVSVTFWAGVAMGGVLTVDYETERWWFVAEMFAGVHGVVGWQRQSKVYEALRADPEVRQATDQDRLAAVLDKRLAEKGLALVYPTDTVARAYAGVAGLLNLMCMFDAVMLALMGVRGERAAPPDESQQQKGPPR